MNPRYDNNGIVPLSFGASSASILHAYSTRSLGNMSVSRDRTVDVLAHRQHFCELLSVPYERTFLVPQTHSTNILVYPDAAILERLSSVRLYGGGGRVVEGGEREGTVVRDKDWEQGIDGVILREPELYPMITTADCAPVGFWHEPSGTLGLAHAGLIGALNQLPAKMVRTMCAESGASVDEISVTIGPCIRGCHYDLSKSGVWKRIGEKILSAYGRDNSHFEHGFFDLPGFVTSQLVTIGVPKENIHDTGRCTVCDYTYLFSNFAAGDPAAKAKEGRFATILGLAQLS